ncbi:hypothetical protein DYB37_007832 [Aphanomyces astaci]|uniref:Uncharacterized protein n=3 Tax=Aphanomyces astaci TaxID=112090 RepID=A0A397E8A6_APHAT|nr:hypothetical protein DYB38_010067 [Aphanomyces astaci]RHY85543.1 hypothetical protein DYB26_001095 [Aphanomyces astaci]RHZ25642.1 hypothetical protein DYB37_007832 [Aphanomyces astaci]
MARRSTQPQAPSPPTAALPGQWDGVAPLKRKLSATTGGSVYDELMAKGKLLRVTATRIPPQLSTRRLYCLNHALEAFQQALKVPAEFTMTKHTQDCMEQIRETQIDLMVLSKMTKQSANSTPQYRAPTTLGTNSKERLRVTVRRRPLLLLSPSTSSPSVMSVPMAASATLPPPPRLPTNNPAPAQVPSHVPEIDNASSGQVQHGLHECLEPANQSSTATMELQQCDDSPKLGKTKLLLRAPTSPPSRCSSPRLNHNLSPQRIERHESSPLMPSRDTATSEASPLVQVEMPSPPSSILSAAHTLMSIGGQLPRSPSPRPE